MSLQRNASLSFAFPSLLPCRQPCRQPGRKSVRLHLQQLVLCVLLLTLVLATGCAKKQPAVMEEAPTFVPSGPAVAMTETPKTFLSHIAPRSQELFSYREMAPTIRKSLVYAKTRPANGYAVNRAGLKVRWSEIVASLELLRSLLPELDKNPDILRDKFRWVPVKNGIKYSGYYQPSIKASRTRTDIYSQAIYALPPELKGKRRHRFYTRAAIDGPRQVLKGRNLELAWADPVDVYFLQIQGSGKLLFEDGTTAYLNYAGQNGHKYRASGRIIREKGYVLQSGDVLEQRAWFKKHPDRQQEIFFANPSYVFFRYSTRGAVGAINQPVDDYLSLAVDRTFLPLGGIVAFGVNIPDPVYQKCPLRGIGFAQDTGGAIKRNRIDIYCGSGERANYIASNLDAAGPAWLLLRR